MNKLKCIKGLYPSLLGALGGVSFLALYIISAVKGTDGEGSFLYGTRTYLVLAILCFLIAAYGVYKITCERSQKPMDERVRVGLFLALGLIGTVYFLGQTIDLGLNGESFLTDLLLTLFFFVLLALSAYESVFLFLKGRSANQ